MTNAKIGRPACIVDFEVLKAAARRGLSRAMAAKALDISPSSFTRLVQTEPGKSIWKDGRAEAEERTARGMAVVDANVSLAIERTDAAFSKVATRLSLVVSKDLARDMQRVAVAQGMNRHQFMLEAVTTAIDRFDHETNLALAA